MPPHYKEICSMVVSLVISAFSACITALILLTTAFVVWDVGCLVASLLRRRPLAWGQDHRYYAPFALVVVDSRVPVLPFVARVALMLLWQALFCVRLYHAARAAATTHAPKDD